MVKCMDFTESSDETAHYVNIERGRVNISVSILHFVCYSFLVQGASLAPITFPSKVNCGHTGSI